MNPIIKKLLNQFGLANNSSQGQKNNTDLTGSQRPLSQIYASVLRSYDTEIPESSIRDPNMGKELIEIVNWCYEARHCLGVAVDDVFAAADGDDLGWTISDWQDKQQTIPIHPDTKVILNDLINRKENIDQWVIGGDKLEKALKQALGYGDSFLELGIQKDGKSYGVSNLMYLPTWEMFRRVSDQGLLEGFDQRRFMSSRKADAEFDPCQVVHIRHDRQFLYGQSIFQQSMQAWGNLKQATLSLAQAAVTLGINPTLHILPPETDERERQIYIQSYQNRQLDGIITDLFLWNNTDLKKLQSDFPNLQPLIDTCNYWKFQIIPVGYPVWFFPGLDTTGAQEIAGEPAKKYARMRHSWCAMLSKAIKQVCDTELVLRMGYDWYREFGHYRIEWPLWDDTYTGVINNGQEGNDGGGGGGYQGGYGAENQTNQFNSPSF